MEHSSTGILLSRLPQTVVGQAVTDTGDWNLQASYMLSGVTHAKFAHKPRLRITLLMVYTCVAFVRDSLTSTTEIINLLDKYNTVTQTLQTTQAWAPAGMRKRDLPVKRAKMSIYACAMLFPNKLPYRCVQTSVEEAQQSRENSSLVVSYAL